MLWFMANYFYNLSLNYTDISSNTIISNTSILFVFIFSYFFLANERFNWIKTVSVLVSFGGATMITFSSPTTSDGESNFDWTHIKGDIFAFISAISYGVYATFLK